MSYTLVSTTRIKQAAWWNLDSSSAQYVQLVRSVRKGTFADLNIVTTALQGGVIGCVP